MLKDRIYPNYTDNYYYYEGDRVITLKRHNGQEIIYTQIMEFDDAEQALNYFNNL